MVYDLKWESPSGLIRSPILSPVTVEFPPRDEPVRVVESSEDLSIEFPISGDANDCISQILIFRLALQIPIPRQGYNFAWKNIHHLNRPRYS
jgi:hypothetical protein